MAQTEEPEGASRGGILEYKPSKREGVRFLHGDFSYPFKRLVLIEEYSRKNSVTYNAILEGPRLDDLPSHMIDTGQKLLQGLESGSSQDGAESEGGDKSNISSGRSSSKLFNLGKRKKKGQAKGGWDIFPGIANNVYSNGNQTQDSEGSASASFPPSRLEKPAKDVEKPQARIDKKQKQTMPDLLAQTFDLEGLKALEQAKVSGQPSSEEADLDSAFYSTVGGRPLQTNGFQEGNVEPEEADGPKAAEGLTGVKDTSSLHIHVYKGLVFVNEYSIIRSLGRGSFGEVKLALNTINMQVFALKLISKSRRASKPAVDATLKAEASVMREISIMKELSHPNLVRLVEVIDDPTNMKILMVLEYVEGGSLFAGTIISPKKRISELQARKYFRDVLQGLSYLHAHKIAHGDLKPDNFLLATNGHIKIADFGSSQLTRVGDLVNRAAGTPAFMAPEMCGGEPYHARIADVWALGVCLYMFIFGAVPFKSGSILGLYKEICEAPLTFPPGFHVSDSLKHLLGRILDKNPDTRMSLVDVMRHPWVTYNWELPLLPVPQGESLTAEEDFEGVLMESWPDDPEEGILISALRIMIPPNNDDYRPDGAYLIRKGEPCLGFYRVEKGSVEIEYLEELARDSDADADEDGGMSDANSQCYPMLKSMLEASERASKLATGYREIVNGQLRVCAVRERGKLLGDVSILDKGPDKESEWQFNARVKGETVVTFLPMSRMAEIVERYPNLDADSRVVVAQRKGELLHAGMLEQLAGLKAELQEAVAGLESAKS